MTMTRRQLLGRSAAVGVGVAATAAGLDAVAAPIASAHPYVDPDEATPGPLIPDPAGKLSLPAGFSYKEIAVSGVTTLVTGEKTPNNPDGSAVFEHGRNLRLVQNHELGVSVSGNPVPKKPG